MAAGGENRWPPLGRCDGHGHACRRSASKDVGGASSSVESLPPGGQISAGTGVLSSSRAGFGRSVVKHPLGAGSWGVVAACPRAWDCAGFAGGVSVPRTTVLGGRPWALPSRPARCSAFPGLGMAPCRSRSRGGSPERPCTGELDIGGCWLLLDRPPSPPAFASRRWSWTARHFNVWLSRHPGPAGRMTVS
jgi:hypothetical protein